jgi:hypothetical protein
LRYKWGDKDSVWGSRPCTEFNYVEEVMDNTGRFGALPEDGFVRKRLEVRRERKMGLGVVALEGIPKGEIVCYLAGAVSGPTAPVLCSNGMLQMI